MLRYWRRLALVAGLSWPALGAAQTPAAEVQTAAPDPTGACVAPNPGDTEAAKQAFRDGQSAFSEGDYARAAELWRGAYDRDCTAHALLLNLAIAQELLGRPDQAAQTLLLFDERVPDSPYVAPNQRRIVRLQHAPTSAIRPRREAPKACPPAPPSPAEESHQRSAIPLAIGLSGGAMALLGGAFYLQARHAAAGASDRCGGQPGRCTNVDHVLDGERARARAETAGWITGAGLLTLAGGLFWHLARLGEPAVEERSPSQRLRLSSSVSPERLSFSLTGSF
jgi:Tetratricopeptide repeat